ncbi:hypothetical protein [Polycladidibacter hongkongensis]|uniref:hypothetical protein n=1 Tax=Polycladidibacter hongkongensis TaxID=1647556 RepID=UPI001FCB593D|nr:hypothetical protein [Pseudovibrio hongkongensis]
MQHPLGYWLPLKQINSLNPKPRIESELIVVETPEARNRVSFAAQPCIVLVSSRNRVKAMREILAAVRGCKE